MMVLQLNGSEWVQLKSRLHVQRKCHRILDLAQFQIQKQFYWIESPTVSLADDKWVCIVFI